MATAADSERQAILAREVHGIDHVRCPRGAHDERWPLVDHGVVDLAGFVVAVVLRTYQLASEARRELLHSCFFEGFTQAVVSMVHHNLYSFPGFSDDAL